jgi:hypothetical protein
MRCKPQVDCLSAGAAIPFDGKPADIERILQTLPLKSSNAQQNTDIQTAESTIYKGLAQLNQCRLTANQNIRYQSVVWLTDAPLLTKPGIKSDVWVETPKDSPFRQPNSLESRERQEWLNALPLQLRSQKIGNYNLSVVDIAPTVQEFCTPAPGLPCTHKSLQYRFQDFYPLKTYLMRRTWNSISPKYIGKWLENRSEYTCVYTVAQGEGDKTGYRDVKGFCKSAKLADIEKHNFVLTPGRYVGIPDEVEDTVSFEERMQDLTRTLGEQMQEGQRLDEEIKAQLLKVGFNIGDI